MGGHGLYVWSSYGLALAILLGNVVVPLWRRRRFLIAAHRRLRRNNADQ
jgi:heme exporter protein D